MLNIVPEAIFPPATCVVTGSPSGPFLDTGRAVRGYGRVYLSVAYLKTLTDEMGYVPAPELAKALQEYDDLVLRVQALEEEATTDIVDRTAQALEDAAADLRAGRAEDSPE